MQKKALAKTNSYTVLFQVQIATFSEHTIVAWQSNEPDLNAVLVRRSYIQLQKTFSFSYPYLK